MKILFSPSEEKANLNHIDFKNFDEIFFDINFSIKCDARNVIIKDYLSFFPNNLEHIFATKNTEKILNSFSKSKIQAIRLYQGVSYKALSFDSLNKIEQEYLLDKTIIFSNLFGCLRAYDEIPFYKLKQGVKTNLNIAKLYKEQTSMQIDELIKDFCIDLRASFYNDFYYTNIKSYNFIFKQNDKILSHSSKLYRGKLLRLIAQKQIQNEDELTELIKNNFKIQSYITKKNKNIFTIEV